MRENPYPDKAPSDVRVDLCVFVCCARAFVYCVFRLNTPATTSCANQATSTTLCADSCLYGRPLRRVCATQSHRQIHKHTHIHTYTRNTGSSDVHIEANPSAAEVMYKEYQKKAQQMKSQKKQ